MKEDVLYLEADEEITAAIDRLVNLKAGKVKIVVPKRSTLLQSIVNLKLMKRAAEDAGKELILVTGDTTATHLAGRVGLPVAATVTSEAALPDIGDSKEVSDTVEAEEEPVEEIPAEKAAAANEEMTALPTPEPAATTGKPAFAKPVMVRTPVTPDEEGVEAGPAKRGLKVPDFGSLQKKVFLGVGALVVIILLFVLNWWFKSATVTIYAKGAKINVSFNFTVDPAAKTSDIATGVLAARTLTSSKDLSATATATGKKDVGTKAAGTITITNYCYNPGTLAAGTTFTSGGGAKFVSNAAVAVPDANTVAGVCQSKQVTVGVTSAQNGDQYNLAPTGYTVSGIPSAGPSPYMTFQGNQMSGGTSKQVTVLTQADVDKARDEALAKDKETAKKDLDNKVQDSDRVLSDTFTATPGAIKSSATVGDEASQSTITIPVAYSMLAVSKDELRDLVKDREQAQIGDENQLYEDGTDAAQLGVGQKDANGRWPYRLATEASAGAKIDIKAVRDLVKGKRYGDAAGEVAKLPGVERAEISLFPMWVFTLPSITDHIKVDIKVEGK
jgi:hypothetical protein